MNVYDNISADPIISVVRLNLDNSVRGKRHAVKMRISNRGLGALEYKKYAITARARTMEGRCLHCPNIMSMSANSISISPYLAMVVL